MTPDEINALARQIADETAWQTIRSFCWTFSKVSQGKGHDIGNCEHGNEDIVVQAARYLDARGLLERPDPENPNIVRRKAE